MSRYVVVYRTREELTTLTVSEILGMPHVTSCLEHWYLSLGADGQWSYTRDINHATIFSTEGQAMQAINNIPTREQPPGLTVERI